MASSFAHKLNLEEMSVDEMWQLHEEISRLLSVRLTTEKQALEKRLAQLRGEDDLRNMATSSPPPIDGTPRKRRKYPKVLPKYRNPKNVTETWSGRGKQPRWLVAAMKSGRAIDEFAIAPSKAGKRSTNERRRKGHSAQA
ncbi:H-NS family nucleoid-associated regulatory protein [Bradyrhizobium sp. McL0616]|uniref:H-NS histone family protein n=1 Tax=Bradyrhizobium sp. McL0616 TaxID=3415674 RepID=UPI003CF60719